MSLPMPISASADLTWGLHFHTFWGVPPEFVPPAPDRPIPSIEIPATQAWTGVGTGSAAFTDSVVASPTGEYICQDGHDQGPLLLHVTIPPKNVYLPLAILFSSREMIFSAGTVQFDGKPVALSSGVGPVSFTPMLTCGDPIGAPLSSTLVMNFRHRVMVGMTGTDFGMGLAKFAIVMAVEVLFAHVGGDIGAGKGLNKLAGKAGKGARKGMKKLGVGKLTSKAGKSLDNKITSLARRRGLKKIDDIASERAGLRRVRSELTGELSDLKSKGAKQADIDAAQNALDQTDDQLRRNTQALDDLLNSKDSPLPSNVEVPRTANGRPQVDPSDNSFLLRSRPGERGAASEVGHAFLDELGITPAAFAQNALTAAAGYGFMSADNAVRGVDQDPRFHLALGGVGSTSFASGGPIFPAFGMQIDGDEVQWSWGYADQSEPPDDAEGA